MLRERVNWAVVIMLTRKPKKKKEKKNQKENIVIWKSGSMIGPEINFFFKKKEVGMFLP